MIPDRFCDIVMKGGITSGLVYPRAVMALQRRYRFKSVGGTSAGAIAAAAAAAAEHDREGGGFDRLDKLPEFLGEGDNLSALFQPQARLRGVYALLLAAIAKKPGTIVAAALRHFWPAALAGAVPGLLILLALVLDGGALAWVAAVFAVLFAVLGAVLVVALWVAWRTSRALPDALFGLCSGMPEPGSTRAALTPWLTDLIDGYAGRPVDGPPLTFGDLWRGKDRSGSAADPALRLEMMTTNLTNRIAERLPWGTREFLFDPGEMRRLFPARVVDHMVAHAPASGGRELLPAGLVRLPDAANLPVIVATRMSLSFPVLLAAVPLWRVDYTRTANQGDGPVTAERCWFSDGGIASNFPVHFFDAPLPRHPTFAINLRPFHPDHPPSPDQAENVWMAESATVAQSDWWYRLPEHSGWGFDKRIGAFLSSALRTMQNRVDEQQMRVPGFRERVLHMSMSDTEGGMNLTMPPEVLQALLARGEAAGERMVRQFEVGDAPPQTVSWDVHRWVRLRTTLLATCEMLQRYASEYDAQPPAGARTFEQLATDEDDSLPYPLVGEPRRALALDASRRIEELAAALAAGPDLARSAPNPRPEARIVPQDMPPRADADA